MTAYYTEYPGGPLIKSPRPLEGNCRRIDAQLCYSRQRMRADNGTGKKPWGWRTKICQTLWCAEVHVYYQGKMLRIWDAAIGGFRPGVTDFVPNTNLKPFNKK